MYLGLELVEEKLHFSCSECIILSCLQTKFNKNVFFVLHVSRVQSTAVMQTRRTGRDIIGNVTLQMTSTTVTTMTMTGIALVFYVLFL